MDESLLRTRMLLGDCGMERLQGCHVAVFGVGGVGSYAAEALARSGVGELTLVDDDVVAVSNQNRQLQALSSTVGMPKAEALAARLRDAAPNVRLHPICRRYEPQTRDAFFPAHYDYIIDAIDTVTAKLDLIETALQRGIPIISALGTGNKLDPSKLQITDLTKTYNCPLARVVRRELRNRGIRHLRVLFSSEEPRTPLALEAPPPGRRSVPASVAWVPGCGGLMIAGDVICTLLKEGNAL